LHRLFENGVAADQGRGDADDAEVPQRLPKAEPDRSGSQRDQNDPGQILPSKSVYMFILIVVLLLSWFFECVSNRDLSRDVRVQGINLRITCVSNGCHGSLPVEGYASLHIAVDDVNQLFRRSLL